MSPTNTETKWFEEPSAEGVIHKFAIGETYFKGKSDFQDVEVIETEAYGKMLVLDSQVQSTAMDEFIYHESLVHAAMLAHPDPKRVYIGGGGEGATAREILRHKSVTECVMVDIDPFVCEAAEKYMTQWHDGAFSDPRFKLVVDDAKKILESYPDGYFDVIILDLSDPLDYGPCYKLYSTEFYTMCMEKMTPQGVFCTQSGPASVHTCKDVYTAVYRTLKAVFPSVFAYLTQIPSFTNQWGFNLALKSAETDSKKLNAPLDTISPEDVDKVVAARLDVSKLQHYDGITHRHMFSLPKYIRTAIDQEKRVICEDTPIFVSHVKADN